MGKDTPYHDDNDSSYINVLLQGDLRHPCSLFPFLPPSLRLLSQLNIASQKNKTAQIIDEKRLDDTFLYFFDCEQHKGIVNCSFERHLEAKLSTTTVLVFHNNTNYMNWSLVGQIFFNIISLVVGC